MGQNLEQLINRPDERYCFRYMDQRVYYVRCVRPVPPPVLTRMHPPRPRPLTHDPATTPRSERLMKTATNFGREKLLSLGTCVGRFTKSERFHISITFLDYLAQYAKVGRSVSFLCV